MWTLEQMQNFLEEDGHAGCAEDLVCASPEDRPAVARRIAEHYETDPEPYNDDYSAAMPGELRTWADELERMQGVP